MKKIGKKITVTVEEDVLKQIQHLSKVFDKTQAEITRKLLKKCIKNMNDLLF